MKNRIVFLYASWVIALVAMLSDLYFSEIRKFIPCELCWYQRILMYPLVLILGIATFQGDTRVKIRAADGRHRRVYIDHALP